VSGARPSKETEPSHLAFAGLAGEPSAAALSPCRTCGACCAFSRDWPRFTTENEDHLQRIPRQLVDDGLGRMRCTGDRCSALLGEVGVSVTCAIYDVRPDVCRDCTPGDEACLMARRRFDL
jgi:Fe-S-cluster containining protein